MGGGHCLIYYVPCYSPARRVTSQTCSVITEQDTRMYLKNSCLSQAVRTKKEELATESVTVDAAGEYSMSEIPTPEYPSANVQAELIKIFIRTRKSRKKP